MTSEAKFDTSAYERFPTREERPPGELEELKKIWCGPRNFLERLTVVNNNYVGLYYLGAALLFFLLAGVLALLMRTQLALPMNGFLGEETYNQIFTMHGTVMMFLFAVPAVEALGVQLLPQMLGARDLPFPRLSAYAFWAYFLGGLAFFCSLFFGVAPNGGWFMYPPLTSIAHSPGVNADFWLLGIGFIEISAIAGAIEIIVGILKTRAPGMSLDKMPMFAWTMLVFAALVVIAFPAIILATLLLELERALGWPFFDALRGGDPLLWQHLFWFFGHPDVYIIFLPAAGLLSMIIPTIARAPLVGHELIVFAILATGFISLGVWAHHMFTTGLPSITTGLFSAASMAVSIPAGLQVFAWIATLASGRIRWSTAALFAIGSIITFVIGGLTGVMVAFVPFDWIAHDTYFIVAHLHYVLIGGMVLPVFSALYYWTPMQSRNRLSERRGRWAFWLIFIGVHVTFFVMHLTGLMGMPRRVWTYPAEAWMLPNLISTFGAFMIAAGVLVVLIDFIAKFRFDTQNSVGNVYGAGTLEWLPADLYSSRSIPVVTSRYPLWDNPRLAQDVERGLYFLPGAALGQRETIVTSPINAEPQYLLRLPRPSWSNFVAAVATAAFFLLLTVKLYIVALIFGVVAVGAIWRWAWSNDLPMDKPNVDIGAGILAPSYMSGPTSHGWWAMGVLLVVTGMIFAMLVFSYVFLWSRRPDLWPEGTPTQFAAVAALYAFGLAAIAVAKAEAKRARMNRAAAALVLGSFGFASALGLDAFFWRNIAPALTSHDALIAAFLSWQSLFAAVCVLMALYIAARAVRWVLRADQPATFESVFLFMLYAGAQGLLTAALPRLAPFLV